jgi:hypothetical protein
MLLGHRIEIKTFQRFMQPWRKQGLIPGSPLFGCSFTEKIGIVN